MAPPVFFSPPKRHWEINQCTLDNFNAASDSQKVALKFLGEFSAKSKVGLYLHGPTGRGKTHLLVAAAKKLKDSNVQVAYADSRSLWDHIVKNTVSYQPDNDIVSGDVIILDDIDLDHNDVRDSRVFYKLVLDLYDQGKPVLMSSNHPPESLVGKLVIAKDHVPVKTAMGGEVLTQYDHDREIGERTLDRIREMCLIVDLNDAPAFRADMQEKYKKQWV